MNGRGFPSSPILKGDVSNDPPWLNIHHVSKQFGWSSKAGGFLLSQGFRYGNQTKTTSSTSWSLANPSFFWLPFRLRYVVCNLAQLKKSIHVKKKRKKIDLEPPNMEVWFRWFYRFLLGCFLDSSRFSFRGSHRAPKGLIRVDKPWKRIRCEPQIGIVWFPSSLKWSKKNLGRSYSTPQKFNIYNPWKVTELQ